MPCPLPLLYRSHRRRKKKRKKEKKGKKKKGREKGVKESFRGKSRSRDRHAFVNPLLKTELEARCHSLAIEPRHRGEEKEKEREKEKGGGEKGLAGRM